jgi:hypothetical protein
MVAVLFLIGQGKESVDVISSLLDVNGTPRKPQVGFFFPLDRAELVV